MIEYSEYTSMDLMFKEFKHVTSNGNRIMIRHYDLYKAYYIRYINSRITGIRICIIPKDLDDSGIILKY